MMKQIVLEAQCLVLKYGYLKEIKQGIRMRNGKVLCWISQSLVERNHQAFDVIYAPLYRRSHCGRLLWCCFTLIVCVKYSLSQESGGKLSKFRVSGSQVCISWILGRWHVYWDEKCFFFSFSSSLSFILILETVQNAHYVDEDS